MRCAAGIRHRSALEERYIECLEPGWVATKMGGPSAPDDLHQGCVTQAWLATSEDELARRPACISIINAFVRRTRSRTNRTQEDLLAECGRISGIRVD